jgi:hypothetical protein
MRVFLLLVLLVFSVRIKAQESRLQPLITCQASTEFISVKPIKETKVHSGAKTSAEVFDVDFSDFPSEAKTAFQSALSVWARFLVSRVPIKVEANWVSMTASTLATAGTKKIYKNFGGKSLPDVWYPGALANAISGKDLDPKEVDIVININKNVSWSYKTDGSPDNFRFDLKTVVMHELAHGLGFNTSFQFNGTNETQIVWGVESLPLIYDVYIINAKNQRIQDNSIFGNPSTDLKTQITSNNLFFQSDLPTFKNDLPKIFAPSTYRKGGSISHLDESKYPKGTPNAMMSPNIAGGEVNHQVGPVILAVLHQIGWPILGLPGVPVTSVKPLDKADLVYPNPSYNSLKVHLNETIEDSEMTYTITDVSAKVVLNANLENKNEIDISMLKSGVYFLNIGKKISLRFVKIDP